MKVYNKYFICLMALLLVGCKKKKTVKSSSTTTVEIESADNNGNTESLEFSEKSVADEEVSEVVGVSTSNFADLKNKVFFGFDRDSVNSSDVKYMDELAEWLNAEENAAVSITVYGNCDQRGSASYNMGLGARRANSVKKYLVSKGVNADRIKVVSLGQTILVEGDSEDAYAKNRVAIVELEGENSIVKKSKSVETKKTVVAESKKSEAKAPVEADEDDEDDDEDE